MKCRICKTEMLVDRAVERKEEGVVEFHYKCPNRNCANYGYSTAAGTAADKKQPAEGN